MTLLGRVCMSLPLDLRLCRIVFYGVLMGCPCDAAVMAAALQVIVFEGEKDSKPYTL